MLAHVAHGGVGDHLMTGIDEGLVAAALAGDILAGLALVGSDGGVHAYRG